MDESQTRSQLVSFFEGPDYHPAGSDELAERFGIKKNKKAHLIELLYELEEAGRAVHVEGRGWCSPKREGWVVGTLHIARRGFGFVHPALEDPKGNIYVPVRRLKDAHDGDLVLAKAQKPRRRPTRRSAGRDARGKDRDPETREGRVLHVLRRSRRVIVGVYYPSRAGDGVVEPVDHRSIEEIYIPYGKNCGAKDSQRVLVRLVDGQTVGGLPPGEVVELAAEEGTWEADIQLTIAEFGLRDEFSREVLAEADAFGDKIPEAEIRRRADRRSVPIITIDPVDAKDFDDAVTLEITDDGHFRLGVFIADVSFYVRPGGAIDKEAYQRGTSVYLPGRTIPMIPERLSNGLCSLRPDEDRLARAVWMTVAEDGELLEWQAESAVIRSCRRYTYEEVQEILDGAPAASGEEDLGTMILDMDRLRGVLHRRRIDHGSLDLEIDEQKVVLDDDGEVLDVTVRGRDKSHNLIEEFMLLANEAVARIGTEKEIPILRRIHQAPPEEDVETFLKFCRVLAPGIPIQGVEGFQKLVRAIHGRPVAPILNMAILRTLTRAEYSAHKALHFALANDEYCHYTSPIRRYPDLQVHRAIFGPAGSRPRKLAEQMPDLERMAEHLTARERTAEDAEREMAKMRALSWFQHYQGELFDGVITAVLDFGFFVRIDSCMIEGMVHISTLKDDYYQLHESTFMLRGRNKGEIFQIGDKIEVFVKLVDPVGRQVDFEYRKHIVRTSEASTEESARGSTGAKKKKKKRKTS